MTLVSLLLIQDKTIKMKKVISMMAIVAFLFSVNLNATETPKGKKKEKAKTEKASKAEEKKSCAAEEKKSCASSEKKSGCCASKKAEAIN